MRFSAEWMKEVCQGAWHGVACDVDDIAIDSRTLPAGALYVALRGENHDGHRFVAAAQKAGARAALIAAAELSQVRDEIASARAELAADAFSLLAVEDPLAALQALAHAHRLRLGAAGARFVGVCGSNGKTTTKEMIAAVLAQAGDTHRTTGNLNNHIGLPLSLLRMHDHHAFGVFEAGMNHPGELLALARILEPDISVLTTVQAEHLEGLGSLENVAKAEGELLVATRQGGVIIYPSDEPLVASHALPARTDLKRVTFGEGADAIVRLKEWSLCDDGGTLTRYHTAAGELSARLPHLGKHNALNAAAAIAVGLACGLAPEKIARGLALTPLVDRRLRIHKTDKFVVLDDCYNANPGSMAAALEVLRVLAKGRRKVAILGDMLELGAHAEAEHKKLGALAAEQGVDLIIALGPHGRTVIDAAVEAGHSPEAVCSAEAPAPLMAWTKPRLLSGDVILVKGSRGMRMERITAALGVKAEAEGHP